MRCRSRQRFYHPIYLKGYIQDFESGNEAIVSNFNNNDILHLVISCRDA